jgi:hypothetical protein
MAKPTANAWLYSMLVTRGTSRFSSGVAAPGPEPTSSTWSPSEEPETIHGSNLFCVRRRQKLVAQNQFSSAFTVSRGRDAAQLRPQSARPREYRPPQDRDTPPEFRPGWSLAPPFRRSPRLECVILEYTAARPFSSDQLLFAGMRSLVLVIFGLRIKNNACGMVESDIRPLP